TPETVPRSTKPTTSSALDVSETTLVLSKRTPETLQTILIPQFELPLSTLAPKSLPEFPEAKTPFPFEKPRGTLASSEKPWIVPTAKISEDSKVLQPQTATYDVFSSPTTSDEPEISESYTATSDRILDSIPPKTSRTLEQPRATLAPSETPFVPQKLEIFTSPEMQPTTPAPQQTTSIPSTPKRRPRPKPPRTKPERTTSAGTITPKISKSPEPTWTTPAPSKTQFISLKPKIPLSPEVTHTKPAPKTSQRTRTRRPRPKHKTTPRPETPQTKLDFGPITPGTSSAPTTTTKRTRRPHPKPKTTPHPEVPQTKLAPKQTPRAPPKPKTSPRPRIPQTQPVPKVPQRVTAKPKTSPSPEVSYTTPAPKDVLLPHKPYPEVSQSEPVLQPVTFRFEPPKTTIAPLETRGIPFIPMISPSPSQEELQTTLEETDQSTQEPFTTKIPRTTELAKTTQAPHRFYTTVRPRTSDKPHIRPVLNRTTTRPTRPKPSGMPSGNGVGTGVKQAPRPSGAGRNVSADSTHPTKKPGTRRPPLPPRPTPPRRKPLPPNNVTGKPGSA
ncbi:ABI3BP isoform 14, partial [Pan troglodytes]